MRRAVEWLERKLPVSRGAGVAPCLAMFGGLIAVMATESQQYVIAAIAAAVVFVVLGAIARDRKES